MLTDTVECLYVLYSLVLLDMNLDQGFKAELWNHLYLGI